MSHAFRRRLPPLGLGLASVVLGAIGLMLFVVPILAAPISGCGAIAGLCGIMGAAAGSLAASRSVSLPKKRSLARTAMIIRGTCRGHSLGRD